MARTRRERPPRAQPATRKKKEYRARVNVFKCYDDAKFQRRHRIDKKSVEALVPKFERFYSSTGPYAAARRQREKIRRTVVGEAAQRRAMQRVKVRKRLGKNKGGGLEQRERLALGIRYMATGSDYKTVGDTIHVDKSTVGRCVSDVTNYLSKEMDRWVYFPLTDEEQMEAAQGFRNLHAAKIPRCIGAVDGTHIPIRKPSSRNEGAYVNRKGYHSINTKLACLASQEIIYCNSTSPGSANDTRVFKNSVLRDVGENGDMGSFYLLGDQGYRSRPYLRTPLRAPRTAKELRYNKWHKSVRSVIERTNGVLKQTWRVIDGSGGYLDHHPKRASRIIDSCVVLHNIRIRKGLEVPRRRWIPRRAPPPAVPAEEVAQAEEDANVQELRAFIENNF